MERLNWGVGWERKRGRKRESVNRMEDDRERGRYWIEEREWEKEWTGGKRGRERVGGGRV
jgi:hypothetical protein